MSIILPSYQHCDEQQFKYSHVHFTQNFPVIKIDVFIQALLLYYILALEKKYAYALRASYFYIKINILEGSSIVLYIDRQQKSTSVS